MPRPTAAISLPMLAAPLDPSTVDAAAIARAWLAQLSQVLSNREAVDDGEVESLFATHVLAWWKDHLALTFLFRTVNTVTDILQLLRATLPRRKISALNLVSATLQTLMPCLSFVEVLFTFKTDLATCSGVAKLVPDHRLKWRAWIVFTKMEDLLECKADDSRLEVPEGKPVGELCDVNVLIVGAGQSGLQLSAALRTLNISNLIVERAARIGDHWRTRYDALKLHVSKWYAQFSHRPWPATMPFYPSRADVADFLERYAETTHVNVLTSTQVVKADYDSDAQKWTVHLTNADGQSCLVSATHLVMAVGVSGWQPVIPFVPDKEAYDGSVIHSSLFKGGYEWRNKRAIVVGTGCSAHDIAHDLYDAGAKVTMVQRNPTMVVAEEVVTGLHSPFFHEKGPPIVVADLVWESMPLAIAQVLMRGMPTSDATKATAAGLVQAGFKLQEPPDVIEAVFNRGRGYHIDVGSSALIIDGRISLKSGVRIIAYTSKGLSFADSTELNADLIVFATGFNLQSMRDSTRAIVGEDIGSNLKPVWGLDEEMHVKGVYRDSGHPRLWYCAGDFAMARYYAKLLALQIKATDIGVLDRVESFVNQ